MLDDIHRAEEGAAAMVLWLLFAAVLSPQALGAKRSTRPPALGLFTDHNLEACIQDTMRGVGVYNVKLVNFDVQLTVTG